MEYETKGTRSYYCCIRIHYGIMGSCDPVSFVITILYSSSKLMEEWLYIWLVCYVYKGYTFF
jgi:hypothetical protein